MNINYIKKIKEKYPNLLKKANINLYMDNHLESFESICLEILNIDSDITISYTDFKFGKIRILFFKDPENYKQIKKDVDASFSII